MPYTQITQLGQGFFGDVWLEEDDLLRRRCAAKYPNLSMVKPDEVLVEARSMLEGEHDHVVKLYSVELENGVPVIRMEYLPNGSVASRYAGEPAPLGEAMRCVEDACRGVEALHARGTLHRDIKPANLLIGEDERIKVSDFGLACEATNIAGAPAMGYIEHLPPEALRGSGAIDAPQGDVYALGVTLYRLINGDAIMRDVAPPGPDREALIVAGKYPHRSLWQPHVHGGLKRVTRKALHKDVPTRYQSASDLRHALEQVRPITSWGPVAGGPGMHWEGIEADGTAWRADLAPTGRGVHAFEISRHGASAFRARHADDFTHADPIVVTKHAAAVLQRVAIEGN